MGKPSKLSQIAHTISYRVFGDVFTTKLQYFRQRKKWPNFDSPRDLSERILSARVSSSFDQYAIYADKVLVRDYVESKGLGHLFLFALITVYRARHQDRQLRRLHDQDLLR